ncbi:MAG: filamentous hemagglutinin N-terminal domain-containing protein [Bacteroidota bacterium]
MLKVLPTLATALVVGDIISPKITLADSIISGSVGTDTIIDVEEGYYTINGGSLSGDGANLFHEFERFNLNTGETADFITATSEINNILTIINGESASFIDGLLKVTGGDANLFLINPAGVLFGTDARLSLSGSLTVTTADQIGFGDNWLDIFSENDYASLVGNPNSFFFTANSPGVIVNEGNLALDGEQQLTLLGGTVINGGNLSTEDGNITVAAVPGEQLVRLSQIGTLLNLEFIPSSESAFSSLESTTPFNPLSLPELLTGSDTNHASNLSVNPDGTIQLRGSDSTYSRFDGLTLLSGNVFTSGDSGGSIIILGDRIGLLNATLNASGINSGGTVLIGGDYQGQGLFPTATRTLIDENTSIFADALVNGTGGQVIVWADDATKFDGDIRSRGGSQDGDGGFVEVSGLNFLDFKGQVDTSAMSGEVGILLLDPTNIEVVEAGGTATNLGDVDNFLDADLDPGATTTVDADLLSNAESNIVLQATNNITFNAAVNIGNFGVGLVAQANNNIEVNEDITTNSGDITLTADADSVDTGAVSILDSEIQTNGGSFDVSGLSNDDINDGVRIGNSSIDVGDGNIAISGIGNSGTESDGVAIFNSTITSQAGDVSISGITESLTGGSFMRGVDLTLNATIRTEEGDITISGASMQGQDFNLGILVDINSVIESTEGNILINGIVEQSTGQFNNGVAISRSSSVSTGGRGFLSITGIGGSGTTDNHGVVLVDNAVVSSSSTTGISITGAGNGSFGSGILLDPPVNVLSTDSGPINLTASSTDNANPFQIVEQFGDLQSRVFLPFTLEGIISTQSRLTFSSAQSILLGDVSLNAPLSVTSTEGNIQIDNINTSGATGRDVILTALNGNIRTGNISTQSNLGNSGIVDINARTEIQTGFIDTSSLRGNAGQVLIDPIGDVQIGGINAAASDGIGGTVDITAGRFFRATDSFTDLNGVEASISTVGGLGNGSVTIRHGGSRFIPFTVGDASINGTEAAINAGSNILLPLQTILGSISQGNIQIVTSSQQETLVDREDQPPILEEVEISDGSDPYFEILFSYSQFYRLINRFKPRIK